MSLKTFWHYKYRNLMLLGIFIALLLLLYLWAEIYTTNYDQDSIQRSSSLEYLTEENYAQYGATCGPFSAGAVIRSLTEKEVDSADIAKGITWKIGSLGTAPPGVKKEIRREQIAIEVPMLRKYTDEERIEFLQTKLSEGSAIILLGELEDIQYQHYLTVLGFDKEKDEFYIYDSYHYKCNTTHTIDSNGDLPGNKNFNTTQLISFWEGGGMYGAYEWFAIVALEEGKDTFKYKFRQFMIRINPFITS